MELPLTFNDVLLSMIDADVSMVLEGEEGSFTSRLREVGPDYIAVRYMGTHTDFIPLSRLVRIRRA